MDTAKVVMIANEFMYTALLLALPAMAVSLVVGLVVSVLQAITSIQEQTLSFAPRLVLVGMTLAFAMSWMLQMAVHFTVRMLMIAAEVTR